VTPSRSCASQDVAFIAGLMAQRRLGNRTNIATAGSLGRDSAKVAADQFAADIMPIVASLQKNGVTTLAGIADALNGRGVRTARGGRWHVSTVMNLLRRTSEAPK
jgi:hypothetical protein